MYLVAFASRETQSDKNKNNKNIGIEQDQSVVALWYVKKGY